MTDYIDPFAPKNTGRSAFGKDKPVGYTITGVLLKDPEMVQQRNLDDNTPETWDDGSPKMQAVVQLQTTLDEGAGDDGTPDDGVRTLWAKGGKATGPKGERSMQEAIRAAGITAGAPIRKGGTLTVRYAHEADPVKRGYNGQKLYLAKYLPPVAVDPFGEPVKVADTSELI